MPLAASGGYILGPRAGFSWFLGAVIGWMILVPMLVHKQIAPDSAIAVAQDLGMGIVLGSGIGFFATYIVPRVRAIFAPMFRADQKYGKLMPLISVVAAVALVIAGVPVLASCLAVLGVWIMVAVAARMTGETNIDPLEQFGIFVAEHDPTNIGRANQ